MLFYSLGWSKESDRNDSNLNQIKIRIDGITSEGQPVVLKKKYDEWIGVCTRDIRKTLQRIRQFFPGIHLKYTPLNTMQYQKILPHFKKRLLGNKPLLATPKNFFKVYSHNAYVHDIGTVMHQSKMSYYAPEDWLTRLYIDVCTRNTSNHFFYAWYDVADSDALLEAMRLQPDCRQTPKIRIASFDLETIPLDGENRVPTGHDENDRIVMISLVIWTHETVAVEKTLLYLNPIRTPLPDMPCHAVAFRDERALLQAFHVLIRECHILTGYNINQFDLPCLLARVVLLNMKPELALYSSKRIGAYIIPTIHRKLVIDLYHFVQIFSHHNLPSFKLDAVAKCKLNKSKFPIKATAIQHYYTRPTTLETLVCRDKAAVYEALKPPRIEVSEFGTFSDCLEYCLEDSVLVYELFRKELALTFLVERANVTAITIEQALYLGNTRYILEVFKTYGTCLGFFLNMDWFRNTVDRDMERYREVLVHKNNAYTYQGALNFAQPGTFHRDVAGLDFLSMYPSILVNQNLSYETSGVVGVDEYLDLPEDVRNACECVPYRKHSDNDRLRAPNPDRYAHPAVDPDRDRFVMVSYRGAPGFLPRIIRVFLEKRQALQKRYRQTHESSLYTRQLNIKLFLNSIYGCMASTDSPLAYLDIAMTITCFARYYLLAVSGYTQHVLGHPTVYGDTDGIFVVGYPYTHCDPINRYLDQPHMMLQFEKVMSCVLIVSKKRYVYEEGNAYRTAGFEKKANGLTKWMADTIVSEVLHALKHHEREVGQGWWIWVNTLVQAFVRCRNPKTYCITRRAKQLHEYKSTTCPQLKIIKKNPSKAGEFIEYTYSETNIAFSQASQWIMEVEECREVNFEKLFMSQKKILIDLLNIAFFQSDRPIPPCNQVLNTMKWKGFVNAEIRSHRQHRRPIMILVLKSVKYTFELNECTA